MRRWVALSQEGLSPKQYGSGNLEDVGGTLELRAFLLSHFYLQVSVQSAAMGAELGSWDSRSA